MACTIDDPLLKQAYDDVLNEEASINWFVAGYRDTRATIFLYQKGYGGFDIMSQYMLAQKEVVFGVTELDPGTRVLVTYISPKASGIQRARALVHSRSVGLLFRDCKSQVTVTRPRDLTLDFVMERLRARAKGSADPVTPPPTPGVDLNSPMDTNEDDEDEEVHKSKPDSPISESNAGETVKDAAPEDQKPLLDPKPEPETSLIALQQSLQTLSDQTDQLISEIRTVEKNAEQSEPGDSNAKLVDGTNSTLINSATHSSMSLEQSVHALEELSEELQEQLADEPPVKAESENQVRHDEDSKNVDLFSPDSSVIVQLEEDDEQFAQHESPAAESLIENSPKSELVVITDADSEPGQNEDISRSAEDSSKPPTPPPKDDIENTPVLLPNLERKENMEFAVIDRPHQILERVAITETHKSEDQTAVVLLEYPELRYRTKLYVAPEMNNTADSELTVPLLDIPEAPIEQKKHSPVKKIKKMFKKPKEKPQPPVMDIGAPFFDFSAEENESDDKLVDTGTQAILPRDTKTDDKMMMARPKATKTECKGIIAKSKPVKTKEQHVMAVKNTETESTGMLAKPEEVATKEKLMMTVAPPETESAGVLAKPPEDVITKGVSVMTVCHTETGSTGMLAKPEEVATKEQPVMTTPPPEMETTATIVEPEVKAETKEKSGNDTATAMVLAKPELVETGDQSTMATVENPSSSELATRTKETVQLTESANQTKAIEGTSAEPPVVDTETKDDSVQAPVKQNISQATETKPTDNSTVASGNHEVRALVVSKTKQVHYSASTSNLESKPTNSNERFSSPEMTDKGIVTNFTSTIGTNTSCVSVTSRGRSEWIHSSPGLIAKQSSLPSVEAPEAKEIFPESKPVLVVHDDSQPVQSLLSFSQPAQVPELTVETPAPSMTPPKRTTSKLSPFDRLIRRFGKQKPKSPVSPTYELVESPPPLRILKISAPERRKSCEDIRHEDVSPKVIEQPLIPLSPPIPPERKIPPADDTDETYGVLLASATVRLRNLSDSNSEDFQNFTYDSRDASLPRERQTESVPQKPVEKPPVKVKVIIPSSTKKATSLPQSPEMNSEESVTNHRKKFPGLSSIIHPPSPAKSPISMPRALESPKEIKSVACYPEFEGYLTEQDTETQFWLRRVYAFNDNALLVYSAEAHPRFLYAIPLHTVASATRLISEENSIRYSMLLAFKDGYSYRQIYCDDYRTMKHIMGVFNSQK